MKTLSKISSKIRSKSASVVGVMVFLLFAQQIHINREFIRVPVEISSSQEDDPEESGQATMLNVDHDIIASVIQFNVHHVFYEIMDIVQDEEEDNFESAGISSLPGEFHKVLFCQVISPNAP